MIRINVARLALDSNAQNTLNIPTVKIFFQRSPGVSKGDQGIEGMEFRVAMLVAGNETIIQAPRKTGKDGAATVPIPANADSVRLDVMHNGAVLTRYDVEIDPDGLDGLVQGRGLQQRLRALGYQIGHSGPAEDGVDPEQPDPDDAKKNKFEFERSVLDVQLDEALAANGNPLDDNVVTKVTDAVDALNNK